MGIKITSVSQALENNGLKFLIHGMAGVGKTVLCATTGAPTLIISAESGLLSIAGAPDYIKTTVVKTIAELEEAYDFLEDNIDMFEWVCLDSISEIAEELLAEEKRQSKDPRQAYGNLSDRMLKIMRSFRDLPNVNVVFTCKQQRQTDEDTSTTRFVPLLPGKALTNSISYLFDEVFSMRVEKDDENEDYHILQTGRDRNYEAKDRSGLLDMFEKPNLKKIAAKIRAGYPEEEDEPELSEADKKEKYAEVHEESVEENKLVKPEEAIGEMADDLEEAIDEAEEKEAEDLEKAKEESGQEDGGKEPSGNEITATDGPLYLYHSASDAVMKLNEGDSIDDDGNIDVIDYKTYVTEKKRIKAENA